MRITRVGSENPQNKTKKEEGEIKLQSKTFNMRTSEPNLNIDCNLCQI
jgi:hypothetical protein